MPFLTLQSFGGATRTFSPWTAMSTRSTVLASTGWWSPPRSSYRRARRVPGIIRCSRVQRELCLARLPRERSTKDQTRLLVQLAFTLRWQPAGQVWLELWVWLTTFRASRHATNLNKGTIKASKYSIIHVLWLVQCNCKARANLTAYRSRTSILWGGGRKWTLAID